MLFYPGITEFFFLKKNNLSGLKKKRIQLELDFLLVCNFLHTIEKKMSLLVVSFITGVSLIISPV